MGLLRTQAMADLVGDHPARNILLGVVLLWFANIIFQRLFSSLSLQRTAKARGCELPALYPHKDPVFGIDYVVRNVRALRGGRFLDAVSECYARVGSTYATRVMNKLVVHTVDPDNVKTILALNFKDYELGLRINIMGPLLGKGIFVTDGEDWAHSRALLRPNFVKDQLTDLSMLERHMQELLLLLPRDPAQVVDLQELFLRFTLDSSTEFLFGQSTGTLAHSTPRDEEFGAAFSFSLSEMSRAIRRGPLNRLVPQDPKVPVAYKTCRDYIQGYVDEAMAIRAKAAAGTLDDDDESDRYYFLKELAKVLDDKERICDELLNILVAGRDTTASLLSSAFHELSRRPDLWKKLRDEIEPLNRQPPDYDTLRNLKFTKYLINETLRLYPPVAHNARRSVRDTVLPTGGGRDGKSPVFVPRDTTVVYTTYAMHRRKDYYGPDADEFRPERWETQKHGWEYLPFNGGPRICLGQQYALTEAMYVVVRVAQEFASVVSSDNVPWREDVALTIAIDGGVNCHLTRA